MAHKKGISAKEIEKIISMPLSTEEVIAMTHECVANNYKPIPMAPVYADGVWVWDVKGNKYFDAMSCYSAVNLGHNHPDIISIITDHKDRKMATNISRAYFNHYLPKFGKILASLCGMEVVLPMNTGAEGVETAIKVARKWGYTRKKVRKNKANIIVCDGNFHGRTVTIVTFSSEKQYKEHFGPLTPGFVSIPFGDARALEKAINKNTVAFLLEPIQGEAGIKVPPDGYLKRVREICTKHNVLMIADEIQTGFCRTGKMFACQHENVKPDMYIFGKALGGGEYPISAVATRKDIMDVIVPGDHGSTFGGNPIACRVACEAMRIFVDQKLAERSAQLGAYFIRELKKIKSPHIVDIRGTGLFIGIEFDVPARGICELMMKAGVLSKETHDYVIRFAPPLIITKEELDWALERIAFVFENMIR